MRKGGGEEARGVRCMCDVCAAHGDRAAAAVGVDVDAQGIILREDEVHFPLNARVECRAFVSERILVGVRWHAEKEEEIATLDQHRGRRSFFCPLASHVVTKAYSTRPAHKNHGLDPASVFSCRIGLFCGFLKLLILFHGKSDVFQT